MVLLMLFTGTIIWASPKLVSRINNNTACTTLIQWNIPLGVKWHRVCRFATGSGQKWSNSIFFIFAISQEYNHICLHSLIEYMYFLSLKIPAKYSTIPYSQITSLWNNRDTPQLVQKLPNGQGPIRWNKLTFVYDGTNYYWRSTRINSRPIVIFDIYQWPTKRVSNTFKFILFADDTNLFTTIEYFIPIQDSNVSVLLNNELSKIHLWLSVNKLTLNIEKTKFMVFHPYRKDISKLIPSLIINGIELERVDHIKCLGVILDENMSWKPHLDMLANKISKYTRILNKLKHYLPIYTLRTLYFSMINSNLNYGILVWGFSCQRLIKQQKKAIRIISRSKYNAHTGPIFKTLDILTLDDLFNLNALKFYYKYIRNTLPPYFYSFNIVTQGSIHEHMTRQRDLIIEEPSDPGHLLPRND